MSHLVTFRTTVDLDDEYIKTVLCMSAGADESSIEIKELCKSCELKPSTAGDGYCDDCGEQIGWRQIEELDDETDN